MSRRGENVYKRKDGRWEGRILKPDGTYQYVYAKTYKEVKVPTEGTPISFFLQEYQLLENIYITYLLQLDYHIQCFSYLKR